MGQSVFPGCHAELPLQGQEALERGQDPNSITHSHLETIRCFLHPSCSQSPLQNILMVCQSDLACVSAPYMPVASSSTPDVSFHGNRKLALVENAHSHILTFSHSFTHDHTLKHAHMKFNTLIHIHMCMHTLSNTTPHSHTCLLTHTHIHTMKRVLLYTPVINFQRTITAYLVFQTKVTATYDFFFKEILPWEEEMEGWIDDR